MKALSGKQGGDFLMERAVGMLPDGSTVEQYGTCLVKLRGLSATSAWLFASPQAKGVVNAINDISGNMERGFLGHKTVFLSLDPTKVCQT